MGDRYDANNDCRIDRDEVIAMPFAMTTSMTSISRDDVIDDHQISTSPLETLREVGQICVLLTCRRGLEPQALVRTGNVFHSVPGPFFRRWAE